MKNLLTITFLLATTLAVSAGSHPTCERAEMRRAVPTCEADQVPCYDARKIARAVCTLRVERGQCADFLTLVAYEMNEGAFESVKELIEFADGIGCLHGRTGG